MIAPEHADLLAAAAIHLAVATDAGVRSALTLDEVPEHARWAGAPGLVFPWHSPAGIVVEQYRPDEPPIVDGEPRKYVWPKGEPLVLNVHQVMACRLATCDRVVVVEGTKQYLAAVTAALDSTDAIVGLAGCNGYLSDGQPITDLGLVPWAGKAVVVIFDADLARTETCGMQRND